MVSTHDDLADPKVPAALELHTPNIVVSEQVSSRILGEWEFLGVACWQALNEDRMQRANSKASATSKRRRERAIQSRALKEAVVDSDVLAVYRADCGERIDKVRMLEGE